MVFSREMLGLLLGVVVGVGVSVADAAVLCSPKSGEGTIKIREVCKKNETQVDPATVGLESVGLAVYDANGKKVGNVMGTDNSLIWPMIVFKQGGFSAALIVEPDRFAGNYPVVFFDEPNCTGTPYFQVTQPFPYVLPLVAVAEPDSTVYLIAPGSPYLLNIQAQSFRRASEFSTPGGACEATSNSFSGFQATSVVALDTLYAAPFQAR